MYHLRTLAGLGLVILALEASPAAPRGRFPGFSRNRKNTPPDPQVCDLRGFRASPLPRTPPADPWPALGLIQGAAPAVRHPPVSGPPVLADVLSRVDRPTYWRDPQDPDCPVTWAHEATHGLSGIVSPGCGGCGLYLLDGRAIQFSRHPQVTIGQVAAAIPAAERGDIFDLYLVKQRADWDREPLYLLDEWNAYVHGAMARRQAGMTTRQETERYAAEMERYCRRMVEVVEHRDPQYPDLDRLRAFVEWESKRFANVIGR